MSKRLVIDLDKCKECAECAATCSYPYHGGNQGVARLREVATQELLCRRCEVRACVELCPNDALEEGDDGVLQRHNMRCTGCFSCTLACPFGNLMPAALQFRDNRCDFCASRPDEVPECVRTCPEKAIRVEEVSGHEPGLHLLGDHLAVRSSVWQKVELAEEKKD